MIALVIGAVREVVESVSRCLQLRWPGTTILSVAGGREAIEQVRTESPDIIILDLDSPNKDGSDVLKQIRLFSTSPVIVLSSNNGDMYEVQALEAGADYYVTKPLNPLEFAARVKALLRRYGPTTPGNKASPEESGQYPQASSVQNNF